MNYNYGNDYEWMSLEDIRGRDENDLPEWVNAHREDVDKLAESPHCVVVGIKHNANNVHCVNTITSDYNPFTGDTVQLSEWSKRNGFGDTANARTRVRQHARDGKLRNAVLLFGQWVIRADEPAPDALTNPTRGRTSRPDGRRPYTVYATDEEIAAISTHIESMGMPEDVIVNPRERRRKQRDE